MLSSEYKGVDFHLETLKIYYCGECLMEMVAESKRNAFCSICDKRGWIVSYSCLGCGRKCDLFRQNPDVGEPCYSCP